MKRVVITGIGVVSPIGNDIDTFWNNVKESRHGLGMITRFDVTNSDVKVAGEVKDFDPMLAFDKKELRRTDLYTQYAMESCRQALTDAGTDFKAEDPFRVGVIFGSGIGGLLSTEDEHSKFIEKGGRRVSPFYIPMMIANMAAGTIAIRTGFKGINYAPVTACASSAHAVGEAFRNIKHGYLDVCVTGGAEATISEFAMSGFNNMKALSHSQNPDRASIPFDKERDGFVMGEGGATLILEELEHAKARGAKIYAEIAGYGATGDAYHMTSPDPEGTAAAKAMQLSFEEAGLTACDVDYVNAHGTSTPINERYETIAIKKALGEHAKDVMVSSTKALTGHMLGAAGAVEAIICAKSLNEGFVPKTAGFKVFDEECDLNNMTTESVHMDIEVALSNSLGFGGHNVTLCMRKYR